MLAIDLGLTAPQLASWLKSLNIVRNYSAHNGRLFNRVYAIKPKLPRGNSVPDLNIVRGCADRTFGVLTLVQYSLRKFGVGEPRSLPGVLRDYPHIPLLPVSVVGAPGGWEKHPLWRLDL